MPHLCRVVQHLDGSVEILHPAMEDRARPRRQVGVRDATRTTLDYDEATEQAIWRAEPIEVPVYEYTVTDEAWARRCLALAWARRQDLHDLPFVELTDDQLPTDRARRHAWRLQNGRVVVDPSVPPPPHPKQELLDAIDGANSVGELKALLKRLVTGR